MVHHEVLGAARLVAAPDSTFSISAVVEKLSQLNPGTVRTHVASRCCVNAPQHHAVRYRYFRSLGAGRYRIEPSYRQSPGPEGSVPSQDRLIAALGGGTDLTLVDRSLRMTPTERLETMRRAAESLAAMRR